jgi:ribonuclease P/MRP protein subunit POP7
MSAVKRVQKLLREAEKRATSKINLQGKNEHQRLQELKEGAAALDKEEVFIKATGRAVDKAVSIGKWFEEKEEYGTRVKTGSVLVVDDIVKDEEMKEKLKRKRAMNESSKKGGNGEDQGIGPPAETEEPNSTSSGPQTGAALGDEEELPESRTRWIKMVEVAVRLKN